MTDVVGPHGADIVVSIAEKLVAAFLWLICKPRNLVPSPNPGVWRALATGVIDMYQEGKSRSLPATGRNSASTIIFAGKNDLLWLSGNHF